MSDHGPTVDSEMTADPAEAAHLAEMARQNVQRAVTFGERLVWDDGAVATVMERLAECDRRGAELDVKARALSEAARLLTGQMRQRDAALALADEWEREGRGGDPKGDLTGNEYREFWGRQEADREHAADIRAALGGES